MKIKQKQRQKRKRKRKINKKNERFDGRLRESSGFTTNYQTRQHLFSTHPNHGHGHGPPPITTPPDSLHSHLHPEIPNHEVGSTRVLVHQESRAALRGPRSIGPVTHHNQDGTRGRGSQPHGGVLRRGLIHGHRHRAERHGEDGYQNPFRRTYAYRPNIPPPLPARGDAQPASPHKTHPRSLLDRKPLTAPRTTP